MQFFVGPTPCFSERLRLFLPSSLSRLSQLDSAMAGAADDHQSCHMLRFVVSSWNFSLSLSLSNCFSFFLVTEFHEGRISRPP